MRHEKYWRALKSEGVVDDQLKYVAA